MSTTNSPNSEVDMSSIIGGYGVENKDSLKIENPEPGIPETEETFKISATIVELLDAAVRIEVSPGLYKLISYADFIDSIKKNLDDRDGHDKKGLELHLPTGTFFFSKTDSNIKISTYYPECIRDVNYRGTTRPSVVPNIVISSTLTRQTGDEFRLTECKYYATRDPLGAVPRRYATSNSGMSILPFTNVYDDGRLCFGGGIKVSTYKLPDLRGIHSLYQILFDAPFNDDLGLAALKNKYRNLEYSRWYSHLADLAKAGKGFPYEELRIY